MPPNQSSNNSNESSKPSSGHNQHAAALKPVSSIKQFFSIFLRGIAMGAADVVPGVSGGTIAFITGIYARLIQALHSADKDFFALILRFNIVAAFRHIDGAFLLCLFLGIITSVFSLAHLIDYLLQTYPILVWATFFGLILASAIILFLQNVAYRTMPMIFLSLGIGLILLVANSPVKAIEPSLPVIFFAGMIAISAMLLPGLSGSFLLLMFGLYEPMLEAVKSFDLAFIFSFASGAIIGLMLFSRLIHWLLKHYYLNTLMLLIGMLLGSLYAIWPWRVMDGLVSDPVLPSTYALSQGLSTMFWQAVICAVLGIAFALAFELTRQRLSNQNA